MAAAAMLEVNDISLGYAPEAPVPAGLATPGAMFGGFLGESFWQGAGEGKDTGGRRQEAEGQEAAKPAVPRAMTWDLTSLIASLPMPALPGGGKKRLSLRHGASAEAVAQYVTSLSDALRLKNVYGLEAAWTPGTADVRECYRFITELGRGHVGVVRLCEEKRTRAMFACKTVHKSCIQKKEDVDELCSEVLSLLRLQRQHPGPRPHSGIVEFHEVLEDDRDVHLIMEFCRGGDLFEHVQASKRLPERDAAAIARQIADSLQHIHACNLVHRDLKLENVLLCGNSKSSRRPRVKVADFGLCMEVAPGGGRIHGAAGSPFYMAPEVIRRQPYGTEVDVWGLGVILYTCLSGYLPFWGKERDEIFSAVLRASPSYLKKPWPSVSGDAKDLIRKMLDPEPSTRITIQGMLAHPWMVQHCPEVAPGGAQGAATGVGGLKVPRTLSVGLASLVRQEPESRARVADSASAPLSLRRPVAMLSSISMPAQRIIKPLIPPLSVAGQSRSVGA